MPRRRVVLFGATGKLGGLIARNLASDEKVELRAVVRPESRGRSVATAGVEVVDMDVASASPAEIEKVLKGAYCVISALQGGPEIIVEAQTRILDAARSAGVSRFIPSTFS